MRAEDSRVAIPLPSNAPAFEVTLEDFASTVERLNGYRRASEKNGPPFSRSDIQEIVSVPGASFEQDEAAMRKELWRTLIRSAPDGRKPDVEEARCDDGADESRDYLSAAESDARRREMAADAANASACIANESILMSFLDTLIGSGEVGESFDGGVATDDADEEKKSEDDDEALVRRQRRRSSLVFSPIPFVILGTSLVNEEMHCDHVLTPPLMDALRLHLPYSLVDTNYMLRYSSAQNGSSMETLLSKARFFFHTFIAIETVDGDVFGSFTSSPWHHGGPSYYGSCQSFLWRMNQSRHSPCTSVRERAQLESDVEFFLWNGRNRNIQMVLSNKLLAVGGGEPDFLAPPSATEQEQEQCLVDMSERMGTGTGGGGWNFGFALDSDLSTVSMGKCATFGTVGLSPITRSFQVSNVELWAMTPMRDIELATDLEKNRHFAVSTIEARASKNPEQHIKLPWSAV